MARNDKMTCIKPRADARGAKGGNMHLFKILKSSFRKRVTAVLLLVAFVPLLIFGIIMIESSVKSIHASYHNSSLVMLKSIERRLDDYISQCDESLFFVLYDNYSNDNEELDIYNNIQKKLLYIRFLKKEHESLLYYFPAKEELYIINNSGNRSFLHASDIEETPWYQEATTNQDKCVVLPQHVQTGYAPRYEINQTVPVFTVCRTFRDVYGEESVFAINCKLTGIETICNAAENMAQESLFCLTKDGGLLYTTDTASSAIDIRAIYDVIAKNVEGEGSFVLKSPVDGNRYTVVYKVSAETGLITFKRILNSSLNQYIARSIRMMLWMMLILIGLMIPLGTLLSRTVTKPLSLLEKNMEQFGRGDIGTRIAVNSADEIGKIGTTFNHMAQQLQTLIAEQYALKLSNQTAQLYSLIAQINPHFINNVLQSIGSVALEKDAPEIYEASTILAKMMRYSIKGKDKVTLHEEMENASDYLYIQKFRFEDRLQYTFEIEKSLYPVILPKLTLQPLVENAVVHGLEAKKEMGSVFVRCYRESETMFCLCVTDDGDGMDAQTLHALHAKFQKNDKAIEIETTSIGLINVYQRLRMIYGVEFTMDLQSELHKGTVLTLHIPYGKEEGKTIC